MKKYYNEQFADTQSLWDKYKNYFNIWVFSFIGLLSVLTALYLAQIIFVGLNYNSYVDLYQTINKTVEPNEQIKDIQGAAAYTYKQDITTTFFSLVFSASTIIFFVMSVQRSTKEKNYGYLSNGALLFNWLISLYNIITLAIFLFTPNNYKGLQGNQIILFKFIVSIIILFIYVLLFVLVQREVSRIRKTFIIILQTKALKEFMQNVSQNQNNNPFVSPFGFTNQNPQQNQQTQQPQEPKPQESEEYKKLIRLPLSQLHKIGEKLNIFGYADMEKEELIQKIIAYTKKNKTT
ncbi:hypothetical protein ACR82Z_00425 [Mycoplasma sp. 6243]|uniref:hypothetical protein n=1 Tax=Mycoplasma sp. 6243 TaxID=3440865 RepID=UPI003EBA9CAA